MKKIFIGLIILQITFVAFGQQTLINTYEDATFRKALELYQKEKYNTAQKLFLDVADNTKNSQNPVKEFSQYYVAMCAINLFNADAEYYTFLFISENPNSALTNDVLFHLGGYFYSRKIWRSAIENYSKTDWRKLDKEQQSEYFFKKGYSYFMLKDMEQAKVCFYEIKDLNTKFTGPALYYYSHMHYDEKNYQTALNGFLRLTDDNTFGPVVPYYIVQIYYMQNKYKEITAFVPGIISTVAETRLDEVSRICAEAFFKLEAYDSAIVYFEKYIEASSARDAQAIYQLAYSYYETEQVDLATKHFESIAHESNSVGQNASYYLASCYIKSGDKEDARKAFASASRSDFDPVIKQDALFNYALLTYEVGGDPFTDAVTAFEDFIEQYPGSKRIDEARRLLIQSYLGSRNYRKALQAIDKTDIKTPELKEAYQRIAFNRGVELFNNKSYLEAVDMFRNSLKYRSINSQREAQAAFWLGESLYRVADYPAAVLAYKDFKSMPVAHTTSEYNLVDYNLAYAYYKQNLYSEAINWFRQFASSSLADDKKIYIADSYIRAGDCYFMQSNYYQAIDFYQRAIDSDLQMKDYALMQKGMCQGLAKKELDKINTLNQLLQAYPNSEFADNAYYETAQEYLKLQDSYQAIEALTNLYNRYPQSELASKSLVQLGLLYYNVDNNEQAIKYYKIAVSNYNGTDESRSALGGLQRIYIDLGQIDEYSRFVNGLGGEVPQLTINERDSLSFLSAEKLYMTGKCNEAKPALTRYIENFPNGAYKLKAHFYKGDCHYQSKEDDEALVMFDYIVAQPQNQYTEQSLLGAARISKRQGNDEKILEYYKKLMEISSTPGNTKEGLLGLMDAYFALHDYEKALETSRSVLALGDITSENRREATFIKARSLEESGRTVLALEEYKSLSKEALSAEGAESKFRVAKILYSQGKLDEAEKEIEGFSSMSTSHDYWIARGFILWSDIFRDRENYFQALETLQSIIDYYENSSDGILDQAKEKKEEIDKIQSAGKDGNVTEDVELNIENQN